MSVLEVLFPLVTQYFQGGAWLSDNGPKGLRQLLGNLWAHLAEGAQLCCDQYTNPALADVDAIKTNIASAATAQSFTGTALNGVKGSGTMDPPRNPTVTCSDHAVWTGEAVTVTGIDINGAVQTETVNCTRNATAVGAKCFRSITKVEVTACADATGTATVGFGAIMGLKHKAVLLAGETAPIPVQQVAAGVAVVTGTFVGPVGSPPYGSYAPATAPDGANDYALIYPFDRTA